MIRLLYFDMTQGNRIAAQSLIKELGWKNGSRVIATLKWREAFDNPFKYINKEIRPTKKQRLSQRQMAPLVILYKLLQEDGYSKEDAVEACRRVAREVALAFLKFTVPPMKQSIFKSANDQQKMSFLSRFADRFFNAESTLEIGDNDELIIDIHTCHFASYTRKLGVPELGPVFCETDHLYFEKFQPEVKFTRTQTLAEHRKPCDFRFEWKDQDHNQRPETRD